MAANDLTTRANVKAYAGLAADDANDILDRLITAASTFIQRYTNRDIVQGTYTEVRSGNGGVALVLSQFPVTAIASLVVDGIAIAPRATPTGSGYVQEQTGQRPSGRRILLSGYRFTKGVGNVTVQYTAGYIGPNPGPATIPFDIEQACIELTALAFRQRSRIGDQSKTVGAGGGHETVAYFMQAMTPATRAILDQFQDVVPL